MTVTRNVRASRRQVWDVLSDGWTYSQWVVGNTRMRAVDPDWPAPGSTIRHSIGVWPVVINDETVVQECVPLEKLVLLAKMGPLGAARVTLRLNDIPDGCGVQMDEVAVRPLMSLVPNVVQQLGLWPRNREALWRLGALAEGLKPAELD
ncbi:SRPBCC family protein [Mycobacterium hubeiense]|uniref:SRPBCC family protein n=1 Tax=Mycobacterium hubeiense TaxID=1867256 RepID=UPI000C7F4D73|nr:SRPBCC family protein [Mycobacterium sp. QGD 101]